LTSIALGGLFVLVDRAGTIYAVLGAVLTTCIWAGLLALLAPAGLPALTLPFVIVTWLMLLAARHFEALKLFDVLLGEQKNWTSPRRRLYVCLTLTGTSRQSRTWHIASGYRRRRQCNCNARSGWRDWPSSASDGTQ
jgi:hypothetical protein